MAALALATIYYGGSAFNKSAASSNASKILTQAQQILGADRLYRLDHDGQVPPNMEALVTGGYLKSIPVASLDSKFQAVAATTSWTQILTASGTAYALSGSNLIDEESCKELNRQTLGQNGVLKEIYTGYQTQCYGPATQSLSILVITDPLNTTSDASILPNTPTINTGSNIAPAAWLVSPDSTGGNNGGSNGGSGGNNSGGGGATPPAGLQVPSGFTYTGDALPVTLTPELPEIYVAFKGADATPFNITGASGSLAGGTFSVSEGPFCGVDQDDNRYYCGAFVALLGTNIPSNTSASGLISVTTSLGNASVPVTFTATPLPAAMQMKFVTDYLAGAQIRLTSGSEDQNGVCHTSATYVSGSNLVMGDNHSGCQIEPSNELNDYIYFERPSMATFDLRSVTVTSNAGTYTYNSNDISYSCPGVYLPANPNAIQNQYGQFDGTLVNYSGCTINLPAVLGPSVTVTYVYTIDGGSIQSVTRTRNIAQDNAVY